MFQSGSRLGSSRRTTTKRQLIAAGVIIVLLAGVAGYFMWRTFTAGSNTTAEQETAKIVQKVGKIYALPEEKPTVAQINDKGKLKGQNFFAKAENGDYLLVYDIEKIALLYREKDNKIINAGPIHKSPAK